MSDLIPDNYDYPDYSDTGIDAVSPAEYEQWASMASDDSLYEEVNALHGNAGNTANVANQATYDRGFKMCINDTSTPADGVPPALVNHSNFKASNVIHVNSQFALEPIAAAIDAGNTRLACKFDMKGGKTYATAMLIKEQPEKTITVVVIASQVLCQSTAVRLSDKSEKVVVDYQNVNASVLPDAIVTTYNSLPLVEKKLDGAAVHGLVFDESEQGAQFMARGTIDNKAEAAGSIERLESGAAFVLLLDAHLGANSKHFADSFMPTAEFSLLLNHYQPWADYSYSWIDGKKEGVNHVVDMLNEGKNLWLHSTSSEFAEKLHVALDASGALSGLPVLAAYTKKAGDESQELKEAKENNQKFKNYSVVISSPGGGVGLSVEGEHFHRTIGFLIQDKDTPDAVSTNQFSFRARDLIDKRIDLVHVDQSGRGAPCSKFENSRDAKTLKLLKNTIIDSAMSDADKAKSLKLISCLHIEYELKIDNQTAEDFPEYRQIITDEMNAKGMNRVDADEAPEASEVQEAIKDAGAVIESRRNEALIASPLIDEDEADRIHRNSKKGRGLVTGTEMLSLKKYRLLKSYHFDVAPPSVSQIYDYLDLQKDGIAAGRNNIARALLSYADIQRIQKAYVAGAGEDELFKRDIASSRSVEIKARWQVDKVLCSLVGVVREVDVFALQSPDEITLDMLKAKGGVNQATSVLAALSKYADAYNAMKPEKRISRHKLSKEPLEEVRALIHSRLKLKTEKVRGVDAFIVQAEQPVIDNLNSQMELGSFSDLKTLDRIHAIEMLSDGESLSESARDAMGITLENEQFLKKGLSLLSRRKQKAVLPEYLRLAARGIPGSDGNIERPAGSNFTWLAKANLYLLDVCGVSDLAA